MLEEQILKLIVAVEANTKAIVALTNSSISAPGKAPGGDKSGSIEQYIKAEVNEVNKDIEAAAAATLVERVEKVVSVLPKTFDKSASRTRLNFEPKDDPTPGKSIEQVETKVTTNSDLFESVDRVKLRSLMREKLNAGIPHTVLKKILADAGGKSVSDILEKGLVEVIEIVESL